MIPILNWRDARDDPKAFEAELSRAARDTGFFLLSNHDVPAPLIKDVFAQAGAFFDLPEAQKAPLSILANQSNRGWAAQGSERLDEHSGQVDRKEAFNIGLDLDANDPRVVSKQPFRGVNVWPDLPGFAETLRDYYAAALAQSVSLLRFFARDLGLRDDWFDAKFMDPMATLRLLQYPPSSGAKDEIGAGAHSDYGAITLLLTDGEPGLQVRPRSGSWTDVPHVADAFVVNIGDCLMRWTNDTYVSTPHRVMPPRRKRRSVAFFLDPAPDTLISALPGTGTPSYDPVLAADYLRSRLEATYAQEPES